MDRATTLALCAAIGAVASGCSLSQQGVAPPGNTFFFPTGAVADPAGNWLFVANSNADLRFNDGTLVPVDVGTPVNGGFAAGGVNGVRDDRSNPDQLALWAECPQADYVNPLPLSDAPTCCWDRLDPNILNCDERLYIAPDQGVRIGSFSAGMVFQTNCPEPCPGSTMCPPPAPGAAPSDNGGRIFIGVRGNTSLTWVDIDGLDTLPRLTCASTPAAFSECDSSHQIVSTQLTDASESLSSTTIPLPDEPYALALDAASALLYVGHLAGAVATTSTLNTIDSGGISLFEVSHAGDGPRYIAPFPSPFPANTQALFGVTNLHIYQPDPSAAPATVYASSRDVPEVTSLALAGEPADRCPVEGESDLAVVPSGDTFNPGLTVGSETRGIEFYTPGDPSPSPANPTNAFVLQRVPPALVEFDIQHDAQGDTINRPIIELETCTGPTFLYRRPVGSDPRLFVNCFDTGEVYVFDPTEPALLTTFQVGRGPAGMVFPDGDPNVAYVIGFSDNNISVVDLAPGSATQYHVVQRIGFPTITPRT